MSKTAPLPDRGLEQDRPAVQDDREAVLTRAKSRRSQQAGDIPAVAVSAQTGEGCDGLLDLLARLVDEDASVAAELGADEGEALAWLYRNGRVMRREERPDGGLHLQVRLDPQALGRFERLYPKSARWEVGAPPSIPASRRRSDALTSAAGERNQ